MPKPSADQPVRLRDSQTFRMLFWPGVWLTLFLLAFATWRLYWKVQLENEKAIVREAGYPASLEELDAWYKKPEGENAADYWIKAEAVWVRDELLEDWMPDMSPALDGVAVRAYAFQEIGLQYPDEVLDKVREYWEKNDASWKLMREAMRLEQCRWNMNGRNIGDALGLGTQKKMAYFLKERMLLAGKEHDWPAFLEMMDIGLKMGNDAGGAPLLIAKNTNISISAAMIYSIQGELPFFAYDARQMEVLQKKLLAQRSYLAQVLEPGLRGEGSTALGEPSFYGFPGRKPTPPWAVAAWKLLGGEDHDLHKLGCHERRLADVCLLPESGRAPMAKKLEAEWDAAQKSWELGCASYKIDVFSRAVIQHLHVLMAFDAAITALAAERYRLDAGQLPAKLDDLVPKYLPAVPPDLFDSGKPLKYKVEADRFTIYSVGKNGVDEGGADHTEANPKADDIPFTILLPNAKRGIVPKRKSEAP